MQSYPMQISIHAPRTGSDTREIKVTAKGGISIHAPRTGSDGLQMGKRLKWLKISIHAPRTGSDSRPCCRIYAIKIFQSTLPARGATSIISERTARRAFQSTLPARGATKIGTRPAESKYISIHAPRTGSDQYCHKASASKPYFNPRSPHGERHKTRILPLRYCEDFNPRSPHGERLAGLYCSAAKAPFQSTLPARGATMALCTPIRSCLRFQSTLPARGATALGSPENKRKRHFNPRSPHGERLRKVTILSIRIIDFAQKVYHKTVLLRISLAENAVILPEKPRNPVRTSLQKAGGLRFARAIRAAHPYSISSPSGA